MRRHTSHGNLRSGNNSGFYAPQPRIADDAIIMRNADMHRRRNSRLNDDQLIDKYQQMEKDAIEGALMKLIIEELELRGL